MEAGGSLRAKTKGSARLCQVRAGDAEGTVRPSQPARSTGSVGNVRAAQEASLESSSLPKNEIIIALKIPEKQRLVEHIWKF